MNLIQISEQIKNVPDQQLAAMVRSPGMVPGYLVVAEMQRRDSMRKAFTAEQAANPMNKQTVLQEMQNMTPAQIAPGVQGPGPQPQRFRSGGIMRLADGGGMYDEEFEMDQTAPPSMPMQGGVVDLATKYPVATPEQARQAFSQFRGPSPLAGIAEALLEKENLYRNRKTKLGDILMSLGLGMAASRRPDMAGAIAEGGIGALNNWTADRDRNQKLADMYGGQRMGILKAMQESQDVDAREMNQILNAMNAARNTNVMSQEATERAIARMKFDKQEAERERAFKAQLEEQKRRGEISDKQFKHRMEMFKLGQQQRNDEANRVLRWDIAKLPAKTKGGGGGADKIADKIRTAKMTYEKGIREANPMLTDDEIDKRGRAYIMRNFPADQVGSVLPPMPEGSGGEEKKPAAEPGLLDRIGSWFSGPPRKPPTQMGGTPTAAIQTLQHPSLSGRKVAIPQSDSRQEMQRVPVIGGIGVLATGLGLPTPDNPPFGSQINYGR